jgi:prepilin-type N-terminal cleavage/methylation domain-containing protein
MKIINKKNGFTLVEVLIVMVIAGVVMAGAFKKYREWQEADRRSELIQDVASIIAGGQGWKGDRLTYTGIDFEDLSDAGFVSKTWGDGAVANPEGGSYDVAVNSTNARLLDITIGGLNDELCLSGVRMLLPNTNDGTSGTCSSGTITISVL